MSDNTTEKMWEEYANGRSSALKEKLIVHYAPIVKHVAGRLLIHVGQHVEYDDLVGYGVFGLIDAIDKFDYKKGVKFETYASFRIKGAIIDHIRKMDWVPRALRQKSKRMEAAVSMLEEKLGRAPTPEEIAEELGFTGPDSTDIIKKSSVQALVSLDDFLDQNQEVAYTALVADTANSPEEQTERKERKKMLSEEITKLSDKEKLIVTLYYFEDLTLKEISSIMKVSESRVSQLHTKAIKKLQGKLGKYKGLLFQ